MQATTDEVLIGRIANGDRLAMQVLFARHHVRVYRFVLRLVREESTAEDLISEVFLDVWRQAGRFEGYLLPLLRPVMVMSIVCLSNRLCSGERKSAITKGL